MSNSNADDKLRRFYVKGAYSVAPTKTWNMPGMVTMTKMVWCFMPLSTLFKSYRDDMKCYGLIRKWMHFQG